MTQKRGSAKKIAELNEIFWNLNEKGQESALTILKALEFAQGVMCQTEKDSAKRATGKE